MANLDGVCFLQVWERIRALEAVARADLAKQGFERKDVSCQAYLNLRFQGTDTALMTPASLPATPNAHAPEPGARKLGEGEKGCGGGNARNAFFDQYR